MEEARRLKISVLCASRGNPEGLRTVIGALDALASGKHDIIYSIVYDEDDKSMGGFRLANLPALINCIPRKNLGAAWNFSANSHLADIYALVTDRAVCVTPFWDAYLADSFRKDDTRVTWWTTNAGPVIPIVPEKWRAAAGGIFTEYFPFWFDDTWLHELSAMVHGLPNFMLQASCFINKKDPVTKRMRDLRFWMDFFIAKRPERLAHAAKIRDALGLKAPDMEPVEQWMKSNDTMWEEKWEQWQTVMGDASVPDKTYIEAKKNAETILGAQA